MATITTKYSVGDTVYFATTETTRKQHPCPDCLGSRTWQALSPAGGEYTFACPRCNAGYRAKSDLSIDYTAHVPSVRRLTIGSVKVDTHSGCWGDEEPNSYMCHETGVGSGSVYRESTLFPTQEEAMAAAELKAAHANSNTEWIAKLYDKSLEISDYQLGAAALKNADEIESRARSLLWNVNDLFATIEEAADKDAILEAITEYKEWHWKRDLERVASGMEARQGQDREGGLIGAADDSPTAEGGDAQNTPQSKD